jgi:hypothetical protein
MHPANYRAREADVIGPAPSPGDRCDHRTPRRPDRVIERIVREHAKQATDAPAGPESNRIANRDNGVAFDLDAGQAAAGDIERAAGRRGDVTAGCQDNAGRED